MQKKMKAKEKLINEMIEKTNSGDIHWDRVDVPSTEETKRDQYSMLMDGFRYILTFVLNKLHSWVDLRRVTVEASSISHLRNGEILTSTYGQWLEDQPLLNLWKRVAKVR